MIFKPEHINWILNTSPHTGKPKTATRRKVISYHSASWDTPEGCNERNYPAHNPQLLTLNEISAVTNGTKLVWAVGNDYAICPGRGKAQVARFMLTTIEYDQVVADISPKEAAEEGFASPDAFIDAWRAIYGKGAEKRDAWVLKWDEAWRVKAVEPRFSSFSVDYGGPVGCAGE